MCRADREERLEAVAGMEDGHIGTGRPKPLRYDMGRHVRSTCLNVESHERYALGA